MLYLWTVLSFWLCWLNSFQVVMNWVEPGVSEFYWPDTGPQVGLEPITCLPSGNTQARSPGRLRRLWVKSKTGARSQGAEVLGCLTSRGWVDLMPWVPISCRRNARRSVLPAYLTRLLRRNQRSLHTRLHTLTLVYKYMHIHTQESTVEWPFLFFLFLLLQSMKGNFLEAREQWGSSRKPVRGRSGRRRGSHLAADVNENKDLTFKW